MLESTIHLGFIRAPKLVFVEFIRSTNNTTEQGDDDDNQRRLIKNSTKNAENHIFILKFSLNILSF